MRVVMSVRSQDLFPGMFVEFSHDCRSGLPAGASLVNFPLRPKPHEVSVAWVHTHWTNLLPKDNTKTQA